ncbi:uncharacterized protein LOC127699838 [Mytilus californianus]|uniref:uncharacterized protein LOC127699838 n=1 Tax=Mytilus californianus TaxID=6549 RepID=UPI002245BA8E|nr:uncharacterized protein LOC127699838 [Mytilus californianus]
MLEVLLTGRKDGSLIHGPNTVISMLHHSLTNYGYGEGECGLHADNRGGQNKYKYVIAYLCWRVMAKLHSTINYIMQIPGHATFVLMIKEKIMNWSGNGGLENIFLVSLKEIRKYQHFRFSFDHPGCVFVKKNNND